MALVIGSNNLVDLGSVTINDYPFTMTGWFRVPASASLMTLMRIRNSTTGSYHGLHYEGQSAQQAAAISRVGPTSTARSSSPMVAGQWHQVTGVFESDSLRRVHLDGGNVGYAYHDRPFDGVDEFLVGNLLSSTTIDAANVAVALGALNENEIQALAAGLSPLAVLDATQILCYHDCVRRLNRPGLGPQATSAGIEIVVPQPRSLTARNALSVVQPCRFAGPYSAEASNFNSGPVEQGQVSSSAADLNIGQAAAA